MAKPHSLSSAKTAEIEVSYSPMTSRETITAGIMYQARRKERRAKVLLFPVLLPLMMSFLFLIQILFSRFWRDSIFIIQIHTCSAIAVFEPGGLLKARKVRMNLAPSFPSCFSVPLSYLRPQAEH